MASQIWGPYRDELSILFFFALVFMISLSSAIFRARLNDLFSAVIHAYLIRRYPIRNVNDPRRAIPTVPYLFPNGQGDVAKFLEGEENSSKWKNEHGPVYRLWSGTTPEIVITTAADVRAVFRDSDRHTKAENNDAGWLMGQLLGQCLGLISGPAYTSLRAATSPPFTHKTAPRYLDRISEITAAHFTSLSSVPGGNLNNGVINPVADLRMLPFRVLADILYGDMTPQLKSELESIIELRESLWKRMITGGTTRFSVSRYFPSKSRSDLWEFKARWKQFNDEVHQSCLLLASEEEEEEEAESLPIVCFYAQVKKGHVQMEEVLQTLDEMLFANLDVTMGALSWNLVFLGAYPDVQSQIREEIRHHGVKRPPPRTSSSASCSGWEEYMTSSSTLLHASILESSRLKPLAAFTVPQAAPSDRVVGGGYQIPRGTNVVVDTSALNMESPFWGEDGQIYRPSRFLVRRQQGVLATEMRYHFWRFGFGPRQCLGRYVVDLLLRVIIAHLLENYKLGLLVSSQKGEDGGVSTDWEKDGASWITHPHPDTLLRCVPISTRSAQEAE